MRGAGSPKKGEHNKRGKSVLCSAQFCSYLRNSIDSCFNAEKNQLLMKKSKLLLKKLLLVH